MLCAAQVLAQTAEHIAHNVEKQKEQSLRSIIEEVRGREGINFIYQDNLVDKIKVARLNSEPDEASLKKILETNNLSCKLFGKNSFVIYKKKEPNLKHYKAVILKENIPVTDTSASIINPEIVSLEKPVYPCDAVKNRVEGKVSVKLLVTKEGNVLESVIIKSSGSAILDSATIDYTQKLKFIPARSNGKPENVWLLMALEYYIENN